MNRFLLLTAVLISCSVAGNAWAGVEFDFRGNQGTQNSLSFTSDGINVAVTGFLTNSTQVKVNQASWGLSVVNTTDPAGDKGYFSPFGVDGRDGPEFMKFSFSQPVILKNVLFASVGPFDTFDLTVDGVPVDLKSLLGTDNIKNLPPSPTQVDLSSLGLQGTHFRFFANNYGLDEDDMLAFDDWQIEKMDVQGVIPEPATVVIWSTLGVSFALLARRRRRRSRERP